MKYLVKFNFEYYNPDEYYRPGYNEDCKVCSTLIIKYESSQDKPLFDDLYFGEIINELDINVEKVYEISWENEKEYTKDCFRVESDEWMDGGYCIEIEYLQDMSIRMSMTHPVPIGE
jgi:hypothetical protein